VKVLAYPFLFFIKVILFGHLPKKGRLCRKESLHIAWWLQEHSPSLLFFNAVHCPYRKIKIVC